MKNIRTSIFKSARYIIFCLLLASCHSQIPDPTAPAIPKTVVEPRAPTSIERLTETGENSGPSFSFDGTKLIYESKLREHKSSQIYILDLITRKNRRITYNDGDDSGGSFSADGKKIIYSSTTDEKKELKEQSTDEFPGQEIYQSDSDGSHIERLTTSPGFDGEGSYSSNGKKILFTTIRDGDAELYVMNTNGRNLRRITNSKGYDAGGSFSSDGKWLVWTSNRDDATSQQLFLADQYGRSPKVLTAAKAIHRHPSWSPDGKRIIFSSNRHDKAHFDLFIINADGTCLKRITEASGNDDFPIFSPNAKEVVFISDRNGKNQLYMMDLLEPPDCLHETP